MYVITYSFFLLSMLVQAKNSKGFTLVELIVVITILAILATIGFLSLQGYTQDAKETKTVANLRTVSSALVNESAVSGNTFGYYLTSTAANGFSGTTQNLYGTAVALTGGTNYDAGPLKASALRIDGSKFFDKDASNNEKPFIVAAVTVSESANNKTRQRSVFQVAATLKGTTGKTALVEGTYASTVGSDMNGLIKSVTGTVVGTGVTNNGGNLPYDL